jgi:titin
VASAASGTWQLRVESFSGSGSFSADVFGAVGTVAPSTPNPPTGVTATATSSTSVTVGWTDASTDETGFEVQRCTGTSCSEPSFSTVGSTGANTTSYADSGRTASTSYGYRVRSVNGNGSSAWTTPVYATTMPLPAAPTNLTATTASSTSIGLTWTDASSDETGFGIQRCTGSACSDFANLVTTAANATAYTDTTLQAGTTYRYRIQSVRYGDASAFTGPASATTSGTPPQTAPAAPTGLAATALSGGRVSLTWTDNSANETFYALARCAGAKCTPSTVINVPAPATSYTDSNLSLSTTYRYQLAACNSVGCSSYTPIVTVKTLRR